MGLVYTIPKEIYGEACKETRKQDGKTHFTDDLQSP